MKEKTKMKEGLKEIKEGTKRENEEKRSLKKKLSSTNLDMKGKKV